jgi:molybdate transport system regulatory protein
MQDLTRNPNRPAGRIGHLDRQREAEYSNGRMNIRRRSITVPLLATVYIVRYSDNARGGKSRMTDLPGPDVEIRLMLDGAVAFGPIQAKLLDEILLTGSISAAQRRLGFGYVYTWKLVAAMNNRFTPPLVAISRRGKRGGGASLTNQGHQILVAFRRMERTLLAVGYSELHLINDAARSPDSSHSAKVRA